MRLLVAEDDRVSRRMIEASTKTWGYEVVAVDNGLAALEALMRPDAPRLALLDWEMPELDGIEVCRKLRAVVDQPFRYLIVLTGRDSEEDVVAALGKGADDFITKPWTPGELRARLGVGQRMVRLQEQLEESARRLALAAQTDYLTQIWNRSAVLARLDGELARAQRENAPLAVLMLDVDHFKRVNDTLGHAAGDQVLIEVARRLAGACRLYDVLGRYGGEEFLAVISRAFDGNLEELAQRFRTLVAETPIQTDGAALAVTVSIGGAWFAPGSTCDSNALIAAADAMMYRAKENGRNRVELSPYQQSGNDIQEARHNG